MILTSCQEKAMKMVKRLMARQGYAMAVMAGYAGTGKTTILRQIAEIYGVPKIVCPTGKSASRVTEATGLGASTIHRWLYKCVTDEYTGEPHFELKVPSELESDNKLLVLEESSMVDKQTFNDLEEAARMLGLKVLCIGDPFQLPPVDEKSANFCLMDPNLGFATEYILLDEIVRQALDSPIIQASMLVRDGDVVGAMALLPKISPLQVLEFATKISAGGGGIICHTNKTRHALNEKIRHANGLGGTLQPGEPLMIIKNNHELSVYNGEIYKLVDWHSLTTKHAIKDKWKDTTEETKFGIAQFEEFEAILAEEEAFGRMTVATSLMERKGKVLFGEKPYIHANLGYALTCHKAQGSEFKDVLVIMEPTVRFWGKDRAQSLRWVYTSLTRAKNNCTLALGSRL